MCGGARGNTQEQLILLPLSSWGNSMAKKLTAKSIESMKPTAARREISDGGSGLYLIVQSSGHRSWALRYRANGRPTKLTLGSLARNLAGRRPQGWRPTRCTSAQRGNDPVAKKEAAKIKAAEAKADTLAAVCASYLKREGGKLRTIDQRVSTLNRLILPALGARPVSEIRRSEIVALLDKIEDQNGLRMADVALAVLRTVLHWHELRDENFRSPVIRGMSRWSAKEHRRARILDDAELRAVWAAAEQDKGPFGALVRLALLTAARRSEIAGMQWPEIGADNVWTLPAARSKTKTDVRRPLSKHALAILKRSRGSTAPPSSRPMAALHRSRASRCRRRSSIAPAASPTGACMICEEQRALCCPAPESTVDLAERALGHAPPTIVQTYNRYEFIDELRHAFEALAALLGRIVSGADAAVIPIGADPWPSASGCPLTSAARTSAARTSAARMRSSPRS